MANRIYSNNEISDFLIDSLSLNGPSELASRLDVSRQSVSKYKANGKIDINNKIISELIEIIAPEGYEKS